MAYETMAIEIDKPILVDGNLISSGAIALPRALSNILLRAGIVKRTDGIPLDQEIPDASSVTDSFGRTYSVGPMGEAVVTSPINKMAVDADRHAQEERESWASVMQQVGAIREGQKAEIQARFEAFEKDHRQLLTQMNDEARTTRATIQQDIAELKTLIEASKTGAQALLDLQSFKAGEALAQGYIEQGADQRKKVFGWQLLSGVTFFAWLCVIWVRGRDLGMVDGVFSTERFAWFLNTVDWPGMLLFAGVNLPFAALLSFCALQVSRHQDLDKTFTRLSLELRAIDPYIRTLPESERSKIKGSFAERFFSGESVRSSASKTEQ